MRTRLLIGALAVALLGVVGCGGDNKGSGAGTTPTTSSTAPGTTTAAQTIHVSLSDFKIDPPKPRIRKTGIVVFRVKNDGGTPHNLRVEGPNGTSVLPSNLVPGQTGTLTVNLSKPGKYEWYCPLDDHRSFGMKGEITVAG